MSDALLETYRDQILELATRHGAREIRVFGSRARGEGDDGSDLDLLIDLDEDRSLLDLVELKLDVEALIHRSVDVLTEPALSPYIKDQILAEAVPR